MRIYLEFTNAFKYPEWNTGTQRMMRNLVSHAKEIQDVECIPVIFAGNDFYNAEQLVSSIGQKSTLTRILISLDSIAQKIWLRYDGINAQDIFRNSSLLQKLLKLLFKVGCQPIASPLRLCRFILWRTAQKKISTIHMQPNDVLVWLGSPIGEKEYHQLNKLKSQGTRIVSVVLDLFSITAPELFGNLPQNPQMPPLMLLADGLVAISTTVRDEIKNYLRQQWADTENPLPWIDHFYLGSELQTPPESKSVRPALQHFFETHQSTYLMVGTIEPRKNHAFALDAFEELWSRDIDVTLCIVGRIGWKCSALVKRIRNHPEWHQRLFMFNGINDAELEYCYQHSKALLFPSLGEGFGLPLVEAMQHGLPVIASAIPIFRELGKDFIVYFDLNKSQNLCDQIEKYESSGIFPAPKSLNDWKWINWQESAQQLIERILQHQDSKENTNGTKL